MHFQLVQPNTFLQKYIKEFCFMEATALEATVMERVIPTSFVRQNGWSIWAPRQENWAVKWCIMVFLRALFRPIAHRKIFPCQCSHLYWRF